MDAALPDIHAEGCGIAYARLTLLIQALHSATTAASGPSADGPDQDQDAGPKQTKRCRLRNGGANVEGDI